MSDTPPASCTLHFTVFTFVDDDSDNRHVFDIADVPVHTVAALQKELSYYDGALVTPCDVRLFAWAVRHHPAAHQIANLLHQQLDRYVNNGYWLEAAVTGDDTKLFCLVRFRVTDDSGALADSFNLDYVPVDSLPALQSAVRPDRGQLTADCRDDILAAIRQHQPTSEDLVSQRLGPLVGQGYTVSTDCLEVIFRPELDETT